MADDWDTVTKIGSRAGGGGAGGPRLTTIKNKSQLNAAQRAGAIAATEKKYGTANSSRTEAGAGQFLTKVDRSDDIVKPKTGDTDLGKYIAQCRNNLKWDQKKLADMSGVKLTEIRDLEVGKIPITQDQVNKIEKALKLHIRGALKGQPKEKQFKRNQKADEKK